MFVPLCTQDQTSPYKCHLSFIPNKTPNAHTQEGHQGKAHTHSVTNNEDDNRSSSLEIYTYCINYTYINFLIKCLGVDIVLQCFAHMYQLVHDSLSLNLILITDFKRIVHQKMPFACHTKLIMTF